MTGIQISLLVGIVVLFLYYWFRLRNALLELILISMLAGLAFFFIIFPESTNIIAKKLDVGRGADLLFYISILFFLFISLKIFARLRRIEQTLTELIRQQAKSEVIFFDGSKKNES